MLMRQKRQLGKFTSAAGIWLSLVIMGCGVALASDHRESPSAALDPAADIADFYAFTSPTDPSKLVMVLTVNPASIASIARTYLLSSQARYVFHIDSNGDYRDDDRIVVRFSKEEFAQFSPSGTLTSGQRFDAKFDFASGKYALSGFVTPSTQVMRNPIDPIVADNGGGSKVFVGQRNDPFFFDSVDSFRVLDKVQPKFVSAVDRNMWGNVDAIVVELPLAQVYHGRPLHLWTSTERMTPFKTWKQVRRQGNPALKAVFIPEAMRSRFNQTQPVDDGKNFRTIIDQQMIEVFDVGAEDRSKYLSIVVPDTLLLDPTRPIKLGSNGRTLDDDIDLMFWFNLYKPLAFAPGQLDGVPANEVPNSEVFPYVASPVTVAE